VPDLYSCLACGGPDGRVFLELPALPVFCNVLHPTSDGARATARGDLRLAVCPHCGHVFNTAFDPGRIAYGGTYENSLHHSPRFQDYADRLADELAGRYLPDGGHVVEIASGQGDFLRQLALRAGARGTGYDPSYRRAEDPHAAREDAPDTTVRVEAEPFDARAVARLVAAGTPPDLILCRQALEHFAAPAEFLAQLGACLPDDRAQQVFFEVPNALFSLYQGGIWDFIYEHVSYFNPHSLPACFRRAGFATAEVAPRFGGQFLSIAAAWPGNAPVTPPPGPPPAPAPAVAEISAAADALAAEVRQRRDHWRQRLAAAAAAGDVVAVWGAGSKGVTFLNLLGETGADVRLVDINPRKHGMFAAGTGTPILPPGDLPAAEPALVVVMNPLYVDEVRSTLTDLGLSPAVESMG
jgi:hypothetical protein